VTSLGVLTLSASCFRFAPALRLRSYPQIRGAKAADLPIEQPTQFKLIVNLRAAKAVGITIPESILLRVDEVIR